MVNLYLLNFYYVLSGAKCCFTWWGKSRNQAEKVPVPVELMFCGNKKPCKSYQEERGTGYSEAVLHGGLHVLHFSCAEVYLPSCSEPSFQVCTANHLRGQSALLWGRGDLFTVQDKSSGFLGSDSTQCVHTAPMPPLGGRGR